jgi:Ca2+:H+ antiporter
MHRIDEVRSQYRKAGKDGLLDAMGLFKRRRNSESDIEAKPTLNTEAVDGPSNPHAIHSQTDPSPSTTGFSSHSLLHGEHSATGPKRTATGMTSHSSAQTAIDFVPEHKPIEEEQQPETPSSPSEAEPTTKPSNFKRFKKKFFRPSPIPVGQQIRATLFPHWITINWLLLAVPVGIGLHFTKVNPLIIFIVNFLAIIPLAGILSFATEEIALRVGEVLGGLLNASFGNAVELIVGIIALAKKEIILVQTSLIGSMLSNLLLVMGMCFFFGGWRRTHQNFNTTVAQTAASLLALAVGSLIIPTAYTWGNDFNAAGSGLDEKLSRGTAIILLVVYAAYLYFQLKSHKDVFNEPSEKVEKRQKKRKHNTRRAIAHTGRAAGFQAGRNTEIQPEENPLPLPEDDEPEEPTLSFVGAIVALCIATAFVGICAEFLVDSINEVTCRYNVSEYFVGLSK